MALDAILDNNVVYVIAISRVINMTTPYREKYHLKTTKCMAGIIFCVAYTISASILADNKKENSNSNADTTHITAKHTEERIEIGLNEQRYHYELAKIALAKNNTVQFEEHYQHLTDYPLRPYLDYALIKNNLTPINLAPIDEFLNIHQGSYLANRLRRQLVQELSNQGRWQDFVYYYTPEIYSAEFACQDLYAKAQLNHTEISADLLSSVSQIWQIGKSHPKACDPLFNWWKNNGGMTDDVKWHRYNAAFNNNKRSLARYVKSLLSEEHRDLAVLYEQVHWNPKLVTNHRKFKANTPELQDIIAYGIKRYARSNPKDALYHWELYEAQQFFDIALAQQTKHTIVKQLTRKGLNDIARDLIAKSPSLRQADIIEKLIRDALKTQDWENVDYGINMLPQDKQNSDRWLYWKARTELALTNRDPAADKDTEIDTSSATKIFRELAKKRSFYGFLSSDILGTEYSFEHKLIEVSPEASEAIAATPGLSRAKELWLTGYSSEAQAEWRFATHQMSSKELAAAGALAQQWGWYNKGINAMIAGNLWDHLTVRFPLAYSEQVTSVASTTQVEKTLIYAIARQESAFLETAKSSAGAMGLMQLMPATARETAQKSGIAHTAVDLYHPEHNIFLGGQYLNELLGKFNGNRILAAAAYNAGPHRVDRWMNAVHTALPYDIWIETIPFNETRSYVQNILSFSVIYSYRLGEPKKLVTELEANRKL